MFPTSVRQSGIGFATLISQTISIGGPYVIYLGATDLKLPYLIMFLVCAIGAIAVSLLPETLGATLPETLDQASVFGKHDKFFSFLPSKYSKYKIHFITFQNTQGNINIETSNSRNSKNNTKKLNQKYNTIHYRKYKQSVSRIHFYVLHNLKIVNWCQQKRKKKQKNGSKPKKKNRFLIGIF